MTDMHLDPSLREAAQSSKAWPFEEARKLVKRYPDGKPGGEAMLFETGYGPSGLPHIGTFAEVVHDEMPEVAMLWSPFWGGDYRFAAPAPAQAGADTDGDGLLSAADDPYAPYYPGDAAVDAVGLSLYFDATGGVEARNVVPGSDDFATRLRGTDGSGAPDFSGTYASAERPLVIQTAAFYSASASGPSELEVKSAWWRQVEAAVASGPFADIGAVIWQETATTRGVVGETVIDWSVSLSSDAVRSAFVSDLRASDLVLGPVREPSGASVGSPRIDGVGGWAIAAGVAAITAALIVYAARGSARQPATAARGPPPAIKSRFESVWKTARASSPSMWMQAPHA